MVPLACNGRTIRPALCGNLRACPVAVWVGKRECEDSFTKPVEGLARVPR